MTARNQPDQKTTGACIMRLIVPIVFLGYLMFTTPAVFAQDADMSDATEPMNRWGIGLQGGLATGGMDIDTKATGVFGGNIRYSFNPMISIQGNVLFGEFVSGDVDCNCFDPSFNNDYTNINLQGHLNMFPFLSKENAPDNFKIYSLLGFGFIQNDVSAEVGNPKPGFDHVIPEDNTDSALYFQFGLGTRIKLSERVDLFSQFDYNMTGVDKMDGFQNSHLSGLDLRDGRNDHFLNFTAGLQIKFGSSDRKHADWHWPAPAPPVVVPEPEPEDDRVEDLEEELDEKQDQIDELYDALQEMEDAASVEQVDDGVMITFENHVLFDFDSSFLKPQAILSLDHLLEEVNKADGEAEDLRLTIVGHTCNIGTEEYNQGLSERRASSVTNYLTGKGFDSNRVISIGRGEGEPRYDNSTREGRVKNRRVEIMIE